MRSIVACLALLNVIVNAQYSPSNYNGTTPDLESIVKGRCSQYKVFNRDPELQVKVDCNELWNTFTKAFINKDPCKVNFTGAYKKIFELIDNKQFYTNKTMFWTGTRDVVHDFTHVNDDYRTLEDTFAGYFANDLNWCGCDNCAGGIDYDFCNETCNKLIPFHGYTSEYWAEASRIFALKAKGVVSVLINGTQKGNNTAYYIGNNFGHVELPTLGEQAKKGIVTMLNVYVINDIDEKPKESCGEKTIKRLVEDAHRYGIEKVHCYDEPLMVKSVLCAKYPDARECQPVNASKVESWKEATIALIAVSCVLFIAVILLLVLYNRRRMDSSTYKRDIDT